MLADRSRSEFDCSLLPDRVTLIIPHIVVKQSNPGKNDEINEDLLKPVFSCWIVIQRIENHIPHEQCQNIGSDLIAYCDKQQNPLVCRFIIFT